MKILNHHLGEYVLELFFQASEANPSLIGFMVFYNASLEI